VKLGIKRDPAASMTLEDREALASIFQRRRRFLTVAMIVKYHQGDKRDADVMLALAVFWPLAAVGSRFFTHLARAFCRVQIDGHVWRALPVLALGGLE